MLRAVRRRDDGPPPCHADARTLRSAARVTTRARPQDGYGYAYDDRARPVPGQVRLQGPAGHRARRMARCGIPASGNSGPYATYPSRS
ncbi:hypothetical protein GCM10027162_28950 [Streptomyces incanus]